MSHRKILFGLTLSARWWGSTAAYAQNKPAAPPRAGGAGGGRRAAAKPTCKLHGKACCDPAIEAHLPKEAVFKACGESDATFLGEEAPSGHLQVLLQGRGREGRRHLRAGLRAGRRKRSCRRRTIRSSRGRRSARSYMTEKAKSPKAAPMVANSTGLCLPGKGYLVSVNASTKVCTKHEAEKLAPAMK